MPVPDTTPNPTRPQTAPAIGVVVIHGVTPQVRYGIQDFAAGNLCDALKADDHWGRRGAWTFDPINVKDDGVVKSGMPDPTISRVACSPTVEAQQDGKSATGDTPYFDVIEAYWSPLDKGRTNFSSVAAWILRSIFVPLNTSAHYAAQAGKTLYDFTLVVGGIVLVLALIAGMLWSAYRSLTLLMLAASTCTPKCESAWDLLTNLPQLPHVFTWWTLMVLAIAAIGAFLSTQALKATIAMVVQRDARKRHVGESANRELLIALVWIAGILLLVASAMIPLNQNGSAGRALPGWFVLSALCFEGARTLAQSWIVNFFGDVQIYASRDENSDFYALRELILERVSGTIFNACAKEANAGNGYDRVYVLAHSLGSTIAMDALIRFSNACEQAPALRSAFAKIRGFVTFGSPLEKTKYFFDVTDPSPSEAREQWDGDLYGTLFTPDVGILEKPNGAQQGIFWGNYWYFLDAIANAMESYRSYVSPGTPLSEANGRRADVVKAARAQGKSYIIPALVARNEEGSKGFVFPEIIPHSEYLRDPWFWQSSDAHLGVLDIVAGHRVTGARGLRGVVDPKYTKVPGGRFEDAKTESKLRYYGDCYELDGS